MQTILMLLIILTILQTGPLAGGCLHFRRRGKLQEQRWDVGKSKWEEERKMPRAIAEFPAG